MEIKLQYKPSDKLSKQHLIDTGNQLRDKFVTVELTTLTPEQRAIVVECKATFGDEAALPEIVTGIDASHYNGPRFESRSGPELDAIPTVEEWIAEAQGRLAIRAQFQPQLDALLAERKAAKEARDKRLAEVQAQYKTLQSEWLPRIKKMGEAEANQPLPENMRAVEAELRQLLGASGRIWDEISLAKHNRWEVLHDVRIKAEAHAAKDAWIDAHGSDQLKRGFERGHDCGRLYTLERAALEAPGYIVDYYDGASWKDRSCPSVKALNEAEAAEALNLGSVKIVWLTEEPRDSKRSADDYYSYDGFQPCEAVVIQNYLGKYDLVKSL